MRRLKTATKSDIKICFNFIGYAPQVRRGGSAVNWWLRSPNTTNSTNFRNINTTGNVNNNNASNTRGVSFGFCI